MSARSHDTLAYRLAEILLKLNQNEQITVPGLADMFDVTERTIYRDLNRLAGIVEPIGDGHYQLVAEYRGKLNPRDLEAFATIAGVGDLFPHSDARFLANLLDTFSHSSFLVRGHRYEHTEPTDARFRDLTQAIQKNRRCALTYANKRRTLEPYRLINTRGVWYLAATENETLKAFSLTRISQVVIHANTFQPNTAIQARIDNEDDIWFSEEKTRVTLTVAPEVAYYFKRRDLLPAQTITSETPDGGLVVHSDVSSDEQILPLVRYWIPHVCIVEPKSMVKSLTNILKGYIDQSCFVTGPRD